MKKIGIVIMMLLIVTFASAITINGDNRLSLCQCETQKLEYDVCGTGTQNISVSGIGSEWVSIVPKTITLNDSCEKVYAFVTPSCYATSGTFPFEIVAKGNETTSKTVSLYVEQCHTFNYSINPATNSSIPCRENIYDITIENTGNFSDEFVLLQKGLNDLWVSYPRESFVLTPGEKINTQLVVNSSCDAEPKNYDFELTLSNTKTNAAQKKSLVQTIESYNSIVTTIPSAIEACSMYGTEKVVSITNISDQNDVLTIDMQAPNFVSINTKELIIPKGETREFVLNISQTTPQVEEIDLTIYSKKYDKNYKFSISTAVKNCYDFEIKRKDSDTIYCAGKNTESFLIENNGTQKLIMDINIDGVLEEQRTIEVSSKQTKEIKFDYSALEGTKQVNLLVDAVHLQKGLSYALSFENCYGTNVIVPTLNVYPKSIINEQIIIQNKGTKNQTYELSVNADWIILDNETIQINSEEEKTINLTLNVPNTGIRDNYILSVVSQKANISKAMPINILSKEEAYSIDYSTQTNVDVNCCQGKIIDLNVANNSLFDQTISIEKIAPEWVSFNVNEIELMKGESKTIFVYFSPPAGTNGILSSEIILTNQEEVIKKINYDLDVFGGNCGLALQIDLNVDNKVTQTEEFTRKDFTVEFIVKNDSNVGFNVLDITVPDYNVSVDFNNGTYLQPREQLSAKLKISLPENYDSNIVDMNVIITTSVGDFVKKQRINLSDGLEQPQEIPITGLFGEYIVQFSGIVLLLIILIVIIIVATRPSQKVKEEDIKTEKKEKKVDNKKSKKKK